MATEQTFKASFLLADGAIDARVSSIILAVPRPDGSGHLWTSLAGDQSLGFSAPGHRIRLGVRRNAPDDLNARVFVFEPEVSPSSPVDRLIDATVLAIAAALPATSWTTLDGPRQVASILEAQDGVIGSDLPSAVDPRLTVAHPLSGEPGKASYLKTAKPTVGRLQRAGMVGGLEDIRTLIDAALVRGLESTPRSVFAKAVRFARALPVEVDPKPSGPGWYSKDAFEYPTFLTLLSGGRVAKAPELDSGWPLKGGSDEEDTQGLATRKAYLERLASGDALLCRARGLAMVFPFLDPAEQSLFLGEIAQALVEARGQDVGTAVGLLAIISITMSDVGQTGGMLRFGHANLRTPPHSFSFQLLASLVAVEDPALRARISLAVLGAYQPLAQNLDEHLRIAIRNVVRGALDALALQARSGSVPASLFEAIQIHDAYARHAASAGPIMAAAADLAGLIPRAFDKAVFLLAISQLYFDKAQPQDADRLMNEAIALLDANPHDVPGSNSIWYAEFRRRYPPTPLQGSQAGFMPALGVIMGVFPPGPEPAVGTVADALRSWAIECANDLLRSAVPDVWSSLPRAELPKPMPPEKRALREELSREASMFAEKNGLRM